MGRPIKKINFGSPVGAAKGIVVSAFVPTGSSAVAGYIVKEVGSKSYRVTTSQGTGKCRLVEAASAPGEMTIVGFDGNDTIRIRKLTQHNAIDFTGKRYTWQLVNDSTEDYIELTLVS